MIGTILIAATAPASPASAVAASSPQPLGNPGTWVTTADYPAQSMRRSEQGSTGFSLEVNSLGEVTSCTIVSTSGSAALDQATCYLVSQRARFRPARGIDSRPIAGTYNNRIRWVLPKLPGPTSSLSVISYLVDEQGVVSDCKVEQASGMAALAVGESVPGCRPGHQFQPYRDPSGQPVRKRIRARVEIEEIPVR